MLRSAAPHWTRYAIAATLCLVATGCALCERVEEKKNAEKSAADLASLMPPDVQLAFFAGNWKDLRDAANTLDSRVGQTVPVKAGMQELSGRWGVDLTDPQALQQKGVAVSRGLGVAVVDKQQVLFIPVEAGPAFTKHLTALGKERYKAHEAGQVKQLTGPNNQTTPMNYLVKAGDNPQQAPPLDDKNLIFAWIVRDGTAIVYPGPAASENSAAPDAILTRFAFIDEGASLAKTAEFGKLQTAVGKDWPIFGVLNARAYFKAEADQLGQTSYGKEEAEIYQKLSAELSYMGVGFKVDDKAVATRVHALTTPESAKRIAGALNAAAPFGDLQKALDGRPALLLKLATNPTQGLQELRTVMSAEDRDGFDRFLRLAQTQTGVDLKEGVLPALDGNIALAIYDADPAAMLALNTGRLGDFFAGSRSAIVLGVKDRAKLTSSLDAAQKSLPAIIERTQEGDVTIYAFRVEDEEAVPPQPVEPENPFKLKLESFEDKPGDPNAPVDPNAPADPNKPVEPGSAPPVQPPAQERPRSEPIGHLIVGPRAAVLITRRFDRKQGIVLASLGGPGLQGPLATPGVLEALNGPTRNTLVLDVERVTELLGPQAFAIGGLLRAFTTWQLSTETVGDGVVVNLDLSFTEKAASKTPSPNNPLTPPPGP